MEDILITGAVNAVSEACYRELEQHYRVVLAASEEMLGADARRGYRRHAKNRQTYVCEPHESRFEKILQTYSFTNIIFFASRCEQRTAYLSQEADLERLLSICVGQAYHVLVLSEQEETDRLVEERCRLYFLNECCRYYREENAVDVKCLYLPHLFGAPMADNLVNHCMEQIVQEKPPQLKPDMRAEYSFLHELELVDLLERILEEWDKLDRAHAVAGAETLSMEQLLQLFESPKPGSIDRALHQTLHPQNLLRKRYGWFAKRGVTLEFAELLQGYRNWIDAARRESWHERIQRKLADWRFGKAVLQLVELLLGYLLMELLSRMTQNTLDFRFLDFRMLYVVLIASVHGMKLGLVSAVLAGISYAIAYQELLINWTVVFYNISNWLPFAAYFVIGTLLGYRKDKFEDTLDFQQEEYHLLENKYVYVSQLYEQALENKGIYRDQIMTYRDSFGRIFDVTQKLNQVMPGAIMGEALNVLEDILENRSIAIYTISPDSGFARLAISSSTMQQKLSKSVQLQSGQGMISALQKDNVWYNYEKNPNLPDYCAPVYQNEQLSALIMIYYAKYEQMAVFYMNLIRVLCGLIQNALEYRQLQAEKIYLPDSEIMKMDYFEESVHVFQQMKQENTADFALLQVQAEPSAYQEISEVILGKIRATDQIGLRADGKLYLLLTQTSENSLQIVGNRLKAAGITFTEVSV